MANDFSLRHPPVVETVLGIQFERLRNLTNAHLGAFWERKRQEWPDVKDAPPLEEQFETFGNQAGWNRAIRLKFTQAPSARFQIKNAAGNRMIQVQNCRLDYNWIGRPGKEYPRYWTVRPEFDQVLNEFRQFIAEHKLGEFVPKQWEVTYVNHIDQGTVWNEPKDWPGIFRSLPGVVIVPQGTSLDGFGGHWHFEILPQRGRLHVELQHAYVEGPERKEVLAMNLTARGIISKEEDATAGIDKGLNLGHDVVVPAFFQLTSQQAQDYWNREIKDGIG